EMALARERKQARERAIQISMAMQALATRGLVELQRKIERGEALNMSVSEMVAMAALGEKLVRQSLGEDPDRTFTKISVIMNGGEPYEPTPPKDPETVN